MDQPSEMSSFGATELSCVVYIFQRSMLDYAAL